MLRYVQSSKAVKHLSFALPPLSLRALPVGLATSSGAGCSARSTLSAPGVSPGNHEAARESSLDSRSSDQAPGGEGDSRKRCHNSLSSLQTLRAMDKMLERVVLSFAASRVSEELQNIFQVWHVQRGGFTGAVPPAGGKGLSTLECMAPTPVPCRDSTLQGGCPPPQGNQGLSTRLFQSTVAAEGGICPPAWPQGWPAVFVPGLQACETPRAGTPLQALLDITGSLNGLHEGRVLPRRSAVLLLPEQVSAPRAHQQLLSSQVLLSYTKSERAAVRERALGRIKVLSGVLAKHHTLKVRSQAPSSQAMSPSLCTRAACSSPRAGLLPTQLLWEPRPARPCKALTHQGSSPGRTLGFRALAPAACPLPFCWSASLAQGWSRFGRGMYAPDNYGDIQIPILGQLLGRVLLFQYSKQETAFGVLYCLLQFIKKQEGKRSCGGLHRSANTHLLIGLLLSLTSFAPHSCFP